MKKVIYTVLTGNYDKLEQPEAVDVSFDYICLSDTDGRDGVWELRRIPYDDPSPIMRSRYAKLHPHVLLPEYDLSVYMDANLCIMGTDFYEAVNKWAEDAPSFPFAVVQHPERDCVWDELRRCYLKDRISTSAAVQWYNYLKRTGMPRHAGLSENNILVRMHNVQQVIELDEKWWKLFCLSDCKRDQLSLPAATHSLNMQPSLLLGPGKNARNVDFIRYVNHPRTGKENIPGKINWANAKYNIRLWWRKFILLFLK